jgi:hypothetical protein
VGVMLISRSDCLAGAKQRNELFWTEKFILPESVRRAPLFACHGIDAKGNGPVSKELKTRPTDLTVLAKNNSGVFPYNTVYEMIDGRNSTIASHGTREMPIWGYRFGPPQAFRFKNRLLAVIDYLNRIQEK